MVVVVVVMSNDGCREGEVCGGGVGGQRAGVGADGEGGRGEGAVRGRRRRGGCCCCCVLDGCTASVTLLPPIVSLHVHQPHTHMLAPQAAAALHDSLVLAVQCSSCTRAPSVSHACTAAHPASLGRAHDARVMGVGERSVECGGRECRRVCVVGGVCVCGVGEWAAVRQCAKTSWR